MDIKNHQNLQDRLRAAHLLLDRSPQCPVVVDTMTNQSSSCYAALPERLYVLQEGRVLYKVGTCGTQGGQGKGIERTTFQIAATRPQASPFPSWSFSFFFSKMETWTPTSQGMK